MSPSYVYFIADTELAAVKIGHSKHPYSRLAAMQTGSSRELRLVAILMSTDAWRLEATLHSALDRHRVRGEWFAALPSAHVVAYAHDLGLKYRDDCVPGVEECALCLTACCDYNWDEAAV